MVAIKRGGLFLGAKPTFIYEKQKTCFPAIFTYSPLTFRKKYFFDKKSFSKK